MKKKQERREEEGTRMPPPKVALTKSEATSLGHLVMDSALGDGGVASYQFPCTSIREWGIVVCATECDDDDTSGVHIPPPDPLATQSHSAMRKKEPRMAEFIFFWDHARRSGTRTRDLPMPMAHGFGRRRRGMGAREGG